MPLNAAKLVNLVTFSYCDRQIKY